MLKKIWRNYAICVDCRKQTGLSPTDSYKVWLDRPKKIHYSIKERKSNETELFLLETAAN